ncbi:hemerythrin domain-containing protein [Streptosporangium sp. LJ11]|uniref:hemerythrin domain-containing protein n=1 Tax=Streptosporangium sp. LJ11 TaxID=3436927 RepID=UPI003F78FB94
MYMAHTAMRREFTLLPRLVSDVAPGDVRRAEVVGAHAELMCRVLHLHHEGEDHVLWPKLLDRGGEETAAIVPAMEEQHHAIEKAHARVTALLPGWRATGRGGAELAEAPGPTITSTSGPALVRVSRNAATLRAHRAVTG